MKERIMKLSPYLLAFSIMLGLVGCAGSVKNMQPASASTVKTNPSSGKSMIVFLRPSGMAAGVQSSIFEIKGSTAHIVGIVAAEKKVAYELSPGKHTFMVVGESADFMTANLLPNKTYYALVTPRMGMLKARFSLKAVNKNTKEDTKLNTWLADCKWVRKNSDTIRWSNKNRSSIQSKFNGNYRKWIHKPSNKRPHLNPQDGR